MSMTEQTEHAPQAHDVLPVAPAAPAARPGSDSMMQSPGVQRKLASRVAQRKSAGTIQRKENSAASSDSAPKTDGGDNTLTITKGELTATGEGSDAATKYIHWPGTDASGVTLGKGYDIGSRTPEQVIAELTAAGMDKAQAEKISKGAGPSFKGAAAGTFVTNNKKDIGEIPRDVQYALLATMLESYTEKARHTATDTTANKGNQNAAGREKSEGKPAGTYVMSADEWKHLHPAMVELLTDLIYQGGYYGYDRVAKINAALKAHDGNQLEQFKAVRELFTGDYMDNYAGAIGEGKGGKGAKETFYGQTVNLEGEYRRNQLRLAYLNQVISALESGKEVKVGAGGSGGNAEKTPELPGGNKPADGAPEPKKPESSNVIGTATSKVELNVRSAPSLDGKKIGTLHAGASVKVTDKTSDGWLHVLYNDKPAYISGNAKYVSFAAAEKPSAPATGGSKEASSGGGGGGGWMQTVSNAAHSVAGAASSALHSLVSTVEDTVHNVEHAIFGDAPGGAQGGQQGGTTDAKKPEPPKPQNAELELLMAKPRLTPEEIAKARVQIEKLPEDQRRKYWLDLQAKAEYQNQRDNRSADEDANGGTCNLTSLAMCLEYLGISNPHPEMQYDEALVKIAHDNKYGNITYNTTWEKVAKHCGAQMVTIVIGDQTVKRSTWETKVRDEHLAAGHSVLCSIVGHIVRVQSVTDDGVMVDNPYGLETIGKGTDHKWLKSNSGKDGYGKGHKSNEGEDNTWPWKNVEEHTFRSILAFKK